MKKKLENFNIISYLGLVSIRKSTIVLLLVVVFFIANILLSPISLRLDLSKGRAYTLSPATRKILKDNSQDVVIKFFVSADLPTRLLPLKSEVSDLLNEYKKNGRKISVQIIDPKRDQKSQEDVKNYGIPELQFSQVEQDKYAVSTAFFGIAVVQGDKNEVVAQATDTSSLEYNLTAAIYKLTRTEIPKVGVVGLLPALDPRQDEYGSMRRLMQQQFELEEVTVSTASAETASIKDGFKSLIVINSGNGVDKPTADAIKEYLQKNGKAVIMTDGVAVSENLAATKAESVLNNVLKEWGIVVKNNLVLSANSELVNFGNEIVSYMVQYPFWIKTNSFNSKSTLFSNIGQLMLPWTSSIDIAKKSGVTLQELIYSTKNSWEQVGSFNLNPQAIPVPEQKDLKTFVVGAIAKHDNGGEVVVIPTSRFAGERYLSRNGGNLEFLLNIVSDFSTGGALSGIRQRTVNTYPLPDLSDYQKDMFKYTNILLLPALLGLYGAFRLVRRK